MDEPALSEQFSLRWNNFHTNLTTEFHALLQEEDLVDVTIAADGKFVQAHKIVLSVCSPYFKELFKINPCKHPIVILQDVAYTALCGLMQFMYCGEVNVCQEELADFLKTAELLQIKGLTGTDTQEQTKTINKRPLTPETKRKSKVPRRIVIENRLDQEDKATSSNNILSSSSVVPLKPMPIIVPKGEPLDHSDNEEIETAIDSIPTSQLLGECSGSSHIQKQQGQNMVANFSSLQDQQMDGIQVGFRTTSRGRLQLVHYGFIYHCNRQKDDKIFWKCAEYNKTGCRGRCITVGESITVTHPFHNHTVRQELSVEPELFDGKQHVEQPEIEPPQSLKDINVSKNFPPLVENKM